MIRQPRRGGPSELDAPHTPGAAGRHHLPPHHPPKARLVLSPLPLPGENYSFPLLDKHHHILCFPPFLLESTERICGPCLWTAPSRGQRTGRDTTREVQFPPQSQSRPHEVNPHAVGSHEPATLHGAAQPQPVWMPQPCFRGCPTCGPTSQEDGCLLQPCQLHQQARLCQHPQTRNPPPTPSAAGLQPHPLHLQSRGSQPPARIRTQFLPHLWDPQWGPEGGFWLSVVLCRHLGAAPPPASIRTLLSEGSRIDILSSREETEAQGAHKGLELLAQAPDRAAEGPREQGVSVGTQGRWARGSRSITPTPNQAQGRLSPLTPRHGPGATLGPLPGAVQMAPCPPALHLHKSQLSPSAAPAASGQRSITGPPLPSAPVNSLWGAEWLSQWL